MALVSYGLYCTVRISVYIKVLFLKTNLVFVRLYGILEEGRWVLWHNAQVTPYSHVITFHPRFWLLALS